MGGGNGGVGLGLSRQSGREGGEREGSIRSLRRLVSMEAVFSLEGLHFVRIEGGVVG